MTAATLTDRPDWGAFRWPGASRLPRWFVAAVLIHLLAAYWLTQLPVPRPQIRSIPLTLVPEAPVEQSVAESEPAPAPIPEPAEVDLPKPTVQAPPIAVAAPAPVQQPETPAAPPGPSAADLLSNMSRYRLDGQSPLVLPTPKPRIRLLGEPPPGNLLEELAPHLPDLPFGDTDMNLRFYPMGVRGDVHRLVDAATPEFGLKTKSGIEVRCKFLLVMVSCGWREL